VYAGVIVEVIGAGQATWKYHHIKILIQNLIYCKVWDNHSFSGAGYGAGCKTRTNHFNPCSSKQVDNGNGF
jgi:hypothetical protein